MPTESNNNSGSGTKRRLRRLALYAAIATAAALIGTAAYRQYKIDRETAKLLEDFYNGAIIIGEPCDTPVCTSPEFEPALHDSTGSATIVTARRQEEPKYSWSHLETMIRDLSNENYYAAVWKVPDSTSAWVAIYDKGGKTFIRTVNPETDRYGPTTRLKRYDTGQFHVFGDKSRWYRYASRNDLVYEVKGTEKCRYHNFRMIELDTPEPVPEGEEDWENYYQDNVEDFHFFHGS